MWTPTRWLAGVAASPRGATYGRLIAGTATAGALVAALIVLLALVRGEPIDGTMFLLVPTVPMLIVGQLWMVVLAQARWSQYAGTWQERLRGGLVESSSPRRLFFGDLQWKLAGPLLVMALLGWLSGITAFPSMTDGTPAGAGDNCEYRLEKRGTFKCVTQDAYERAGASQQRLVAGVLLAFFSLHSGAALGGLQAAPGRSSAA